MYLLNPLQPTIINNFNIINLEFSRESQMKSNKLLKKIDTFIIHIRKSLCNSLKQFFKKFDSLEGQALIMQIT